MERDEIFDKIREVLVEALSVDEDEVTPEATIFGDLGAESIDILDIQFQLEQSFGFKIAQGELFPEGVAQNPEYVEGGKLTPAGIALLRERMPHFDVSALEKDPSVEQVQSILTVEALVRFVDSKLAAA
ncbi:MAG: acyl carrier protein [Phycisphaerae bacterium]|nr:acyl carrier protein [Phycisphaerae bacterium]